jgi:hypothetical protein
MATSSDRDRTDQPDAQQHQEKNEGDNTEDISTEQITAGPDTADPVSRAYARTGRQDTTGVSGLPAYDEDAGEERRKLYKEGAEIVSRTD